MYLEEQQACDSPHRPLDNIAEMADEVGAISERLQSFVDRFHGSSALARNALGDAKMGPTPVPSGYRGQIDRLRGAIAIVDKLSRELGDIG